jgi:hypothetical protein
MRLRLVQHFPEAPMQVEQLLAIDCGTVVAVEEKRRMDRTGRGSLIQGPPVRRQGFVDRPQIDQEGGHAR